MPEPNELKRHIVFSGRHETERYTSHNSEGSNFEILPRNRSDHGQIIKDKLLE